jgi:hypothetical protein
LEQLPTALTHLQLYNLHLASHYRLRRSSMGWYPHDHPRWDLTEVMRITSPATIRSLQRRDLLDGTPDQMIQSYNFAHGSIPELWTNERGIDLLEVIRHDTGIFYDVTTDTLVYPDYRARGYGSIAVH